MPDTTGTIAASDLSDVAAVTGPANNRRVDATQSPRIVWCIYWRGVSATSDAFRVMYSTDNGATWNSGGNFGAAGTSTTFFSRAAVSMFIDLDDYMHVVYVDPSTGNLMYRRGTPNAGRTAYTFSGATQIRANATGPNYYPDLVAHRAVDVAGDWRVHVVWSSTATGQTAYARLNVTAAGAVSLASGPTVVSGRYASAGSTFSVPSIDFRHTGDGKTVQSSLPHLYMTWGTGARSSTAGESFRRAAYSAGAWTFGTEVQTASDGLPTPGGAWRVCRYDGTRILMPGATDDNGDEIIIYTEAGALTKRRFLVSTNDPPWSGTACVMTDGTVIFVGPGVVSPSALRYAKVAYGTTDFPAVTWRSLVVSTWDLGAATLTHYPASVQKVPIAYTTGSDNPRNLLAYTVDEAPQPANVTGANTMTATGAMPGEADGLAVEAYAPYRATDVLTIDLGDPAPQVKRTPSHVRVSIGNGVAYKDINVWVLEDTDPDAIQTLDDIGAARNLLVPVPVAASGLHAVRASADATKPTNLPSVINVEAGSVGEVFPARATALGYTVTTNTAAAALADVQAFDVVIADRGFASVTKKQLLRDAFAAGKSIISRGNDTYDLAPLYTGTTVRSASGQITNIRSVVLEFDNIVNYGLRRIEPVTNNDDRAGAATGLGTDVVVLATSEQGDPMVFLLEDRVTNARWLHFLTLAGDNTLFDAAMRYVAELPNLRYFWVEQGDDAAVAPVEGNDPAMPTQVNKWVYQAYDYTNVASPSTYVFPVNPTTIVRTLGKDSYDIEPTTVNGGTVFTWEGNATPPTWRWGGRILDQAMYDQLVTWHTIGARIYVTDHLGQRYVMKIESFDVTRVRDKDRRWHHEYEVTAYALRGAGVMT